MKVLNTTIYVLLFLSLNTSMARTIPVPDNLKDENKTSVREELVKLCPECGTLVFNLTRKIYQDCGYASQEDFESYALSDGGSLLFTLLSISHPYGPMAINYSIDHMMCDVEAWSHEVNEFVELLASYDESTPIY